MEMQICSINSGSNGNCYYVGNDRDAVLIDAGISCRETEKRMKKKGLDMSRVKAIFISHEHGDHIKGLTTLANRYYLPVYITPKTANNGARLIRHLSHSFTQDEPVRIGSLSVTPFVKQHDAIDPHSFIISSGDITIGVFTDIGTVCDKLVHYFKQCHAAFLETNYDEEMLENGPYPVHLKNRIRGDQGHLSNKQALDLFIQHRPPFMSHLILSHLSKENNEPQRAADLFVPHARDVDIIVASRYEATETISIKAGNHTGNEQPALKSKALQLGLFN
ncbi:MAG: MBL fold metallo-hydrolase [Chitinophagaceae bacterium]|nr:MBL fold metallo-hydrolase [Chitinophagaceae bacterium]